MPTLLIQHPEQVGQTAQNESIDLSVGGWDTDSYALEAIVYEWVLGNGQPGNAYGGERSTRRTLGGTLIRDATTNAWLNTLFRLRRQVVRMRYLTPATPGTTQRATTLGIYKVQSVNIDGDYNMGEQPRRIRWRIELVQEPNTAPYEEQFGTAQLVVTAPSRLASATNRDITILPWPTTITLGLDTMTDMVRSFLPFPLQLRVSHHTPEVMFANTWTLSATQFVGPGSTITVTPEGDQLRTVSMTLELESGNQRFGEPVTLTWPIILDPNE